MSTNLLSVIEQQQKALKHAIKWLNICDKPRECMPLHDALAAGQQALEQTQVEAEPEWNDENVIAYCIARGISAAKAFTTGATQPQATEPAPSPEVLQALTDPENQPNQFGVAFGMHGPRMFFSIGNQSFDLAYEPDEAEEFEFMKRMLCNAFYTFTPDVKTVPAPSTAGEREVSLVEAFDNARKLVTPEILESFDSLLQSTADHTPDAVKMVAALPVGELTLEQITRIYDRYGGDMVNCTRAIERELAAARSQPTTEESLVVAGAQPVREPLSEDRIYEITGTQQRDAMMRTMAVNIARWVEQEHGITKKGE